jgi:hypothetical protein
MIYSYLNLSLHFKDHAARKVPDLLKFLNRILGGIFYFEQIIIAVI